MGLTEEIAGQVGIKVVKRGSLVLVAYSDAMVLLDGCEAAGMRVLGIEGFLLRGNLVVPDMDLIADFSDMKLASASILEARKFISSVSINGDVFDFSLSVE